MTQTAYLLDVTPPNRPQALVQLFGRPGRAGVLVVQEDLAPVRYRLTKVEFAVLLALADQALADLPLPPFSPRGFLTTQQLKDRLHVWGPRVLSPHYAVKHVYRARKRLSAAQPAQQLAGRDWAHEFLERSDLLEAYRISVPPEQISVFRTDLWAESVSRESAGMRGDPPPPVGLIRA
jgi:hypothetical protein